MRVNGKSNGSERRSPFKYSSLIQSYWLSNSPAPFVFFNTLFPLEAVNPLLPPPTKKGRREIFPIFRDEWISRQKLDKKRRRNIHGVETLFFLVVNCNSRMDIIKNTLSVGRKKRTPLETDAFFLPWDLVLQISSRGFEAESRRCKKKKKIKIPKTTFTGGGAKQAFLPSTCPHFAHWCYFVHSATGNL